MGYLVIYFSTQIYLLNDMFLTSELALTNGMQVVPQNPSFAPRQTFWEEQLAEKHFLMAHMRGRPSRYNYCTVQTAGIYLWCLHIVAYVQCSQMQDRKAPTSMIEITLLLLLLSVVKSS